MEGNIDRSQPTSLTHNISNFEYPLWLMRYPRLIYILYMVNYFFHFRKWYVMPAIRREIRLLGQSVSWMDIGCGEGQYLIPVSRSFRSLHCTGMDMRRSNIDFLQRLSPGRNMRLLVGNIETWQEQETTDVLSCIGVLQYIRDDGQALRNMLTIVKPGGKMLLYVPVNGKIHTSLYQRLLNSHEHYETINDRKRIYRSEEIRDKVQEAGWQIQQLQFTYGYCGRLSHEITNSLLLLIMSSGWLYKILYTMVLLAISPFILLLMLIDHSRLHSTGNGLLITAVKPTAVVL